MDYERMEALLNNVIEHYLYRIEMWNCISSLGIKPYKDGNQWCYLYGNNIQDGVCGFGKTILEAAINFYREVGEEEE